MDSLKAEWAICEVTTKHSMAAHHMLHTWKTSPPIEILKRVPCQSNNVAEKDAGGVLPLLQEPADPATWGREEGRESCLAFVQKLPINYFIDKYWLRSL